MQELVFSRTVSLLGRPLCCTVSKLDAGIHVLLTGGDSGHIGAVSIAAPGETLRTSCLPGHRDDSISDPWAQRISDALDTVCCVVCGIHYDNASRQQIAEILQETDALLLQLLQVFSDGSEKAVSEN